MLNLKVMMFMCLAVTVAFCENDQNKLNITTARESCLLETNVTAEEFQSMLATPNSGGLIILKTQAHKCLFGCMMRKNHIIDNGNVSVEVLNRYVLNFFGTSDSKRRLISKKVEQIVDTCAKKDNLPTEECELAGIIVSCLVIEANKADLANDSVGQPVTKVSTSPSENSSII